MNNSIYASSTNGNCESSTSRSYGGRTVSNIRHASFRPNVFFNNLFSRALTTVQNWRNRRIAVRQLRAMPTALLRDIGIERHQIIDVVHGLDVHAEIHSLPKQNSKNSHTGRHEIKRAA